MSISTFLNVQLKNQQNKPSNPAGTTSATLVMAGLAISFVPTNSKKVLVFAQAQATNATSADGSGMQIYHGTGTAPNNGDAVTGTADGNFARYDSVSGTEVGMITCVAYISNLTLGTTYWFDLAQNAINGGTSSLTSLNYIITEIF